MKKLCVLIFTLFILCEASLFAAFNSTGVNSFTSTIDSKGNVSSYIANITYVEESNTVSRGVLLLFVPEQYSSTLDGDSLFSENNLGVGQYHLPNDETYYTENKAGWRAEVFNPADYEGVLTDELKIKGENYISKYPNPYVGKPRFLTFTNLALYSDPTKGLDTTKSYSVYFILRTVDTTSGRPLIFRNAQRDFVNNTIGGTMGSVLPMKITLKKKNLGTGKYDETVINTHVVEGSTISYDTWPASEIAGEGYIINSSKSSGAGTVKAQDGVGAKTTSNRRAQDMTIYYDFEGLSVTLNPNGGTIKTNSVNVPNNKPLPESDDIIPKKRWGKFLGWTTDSNATTVTVTSTTNVTSNVAYYAVWEHVHEWEFSAEKTTLLARCSMPGCENHDKENAITLVLQANGNSGLFANIQPSNATNKNVIWSSSNTSILTVDQKGFIRGLKAGTANVTATSTDGSNVSSTCTVKVQGKPE